MATPFAPSEATGRVGVPRKAHARRVKAGYDPRMNRALALSSALLSLSAFAADRVPLQFGIAQQYGDEHARKARAQLEPYLEKLLGAKVTVTVYGSNDLLGDALVANKVDLAWMTPLAFVLAAKKNPEVVAVSKAVLASTGNLPSEVIAAKPDFDRKRLLPTATAFGQMAKSDEGKKVLNESFRAQAWGLAVEGDFDAVIDLVKGDGARWKIATPDLEPKAPPAKKTASTP